MKVVYLNISIIEVYFICLCVSCLFFFEIFTTILFTCVIERIMKIVTLIRDIDNNGLETAGTTPWRALFATSIYPFVLSSILFEKRNLLFVGPYLLLNNSINYLNTSHCPASHINISILFNIARRGGVMPSTSFFG